MQYKVKVIMILALFLFICNVEFALFTKATCRLKMLIKLSIQDGFPGQSPPGMKKKKKMMEGGRRRFSKQTWITWMHAFDREEGWIQT